MRRSLVLLSALSLAAPAGAQVRVYTSQSTNIAGNRAMIGISTSSGSKRDTLGVLVASLTEGGPADKAGIGEGDRIQAINGVSLKVSRDDAGDDEMGGIMQRRLSRELGKVKAGDDVSLQVWHDGASKSYKVKTVSADDLTPAKRERKAEEDRAVIGIGFGLTGSKRDTAGVFVNSVTEDGPAEKAGIVEGDRIAAINGVSLKMSKDDIEDGWIANSRINRLSREVQKAKPGDVAELTVVSGGRARQVKVTLAKASSLKGRTGMTIFRGDGGSNGFTFSVPTPPAAPMAPMPPMPPMVRYRYDDRDMTEARIELDGVRQQIERTLKSELPKMKIELRKGLEDARKQIEIEGVMLRSARTVRM